jgi:hypothetical protein
MRGDHPEVTRNLQPVEREGVAARDMIVQPSDRPVSGSEGMMSSGTSTHTIVASLAASRSAASKPSAPACSRASSRRTHTIGETGVA